MGQYLGMTPRWKAVAVELEERIARGDHGADGSLPTESALCTEFGVSRITVRRALDSLRADGLVTAGRGRGWRVTGVQSGPPIGLFRVTNHEGPDAVTLSIDTLSFETRPTSDSDPGRGQRVLRAVRLARSGDTPIDLIEILIGEPFASAITEADINDCPPARLLARKGCVLGRTDQWATAQAATTEDAPLGVEPGAPLLVVERTVFDSESPILRTIHRHPGHLVRLDVTFPITSTHDAAPVRIVRDKGT